MCSCVFVSSVFRIFLLSISPTEFWSMSPFVTTQFRRSAAFAAASISTIPHLSAEEEHIFDVILALERDPWSVKLSHHHSSAVSLLRPAEVWRKKLLQDQQELQDLEKPQRKVELRAIMCMELMAKKNFRENSNMPDNTPKQQAKLAKKFDRDRKNLQNLMDTHQKLQIKHAKSNLRALQNKQKEQVTFLDASIKECRDRFVQDWTAHKQSHREEETFFQKKKQDILKQMKAPKKEKKKVKKHQQKQKQQQDQKKKTEKKDFVVVHPGANDGSYWKQVPLSQPVAFGPDWTHERWYS